MENQALQRLESEPSDVIVHQPLPPPSLFGTADPVEVVARASRVAASLKEVIKAQGLISKISGKEYPRCEAWTLLGTMLGVFPVLVWTRAMENGWEARVEARTRDGAIVGAAEAQCLKTERNWGNRDDFALRSMAQTRATAKALRMPLGFVMTLGGFQATPAEEMDFEKQPTKSSAPNTATGAAKPPAARSEPGSAGKPVPLDEPATEEQRIRWVKQLKTIEDKATEYGYTNGILLPPATDFPGEPIECWPLGHTPSTKWSAEKLFAKIQGFQKPAGASAPPSTGAPPASGASQAPKQANTGAQKPEPEHHKADWYQFPVPFGKHAGKMLGELEKNVLFGFWCNFEVETEWNGRPKKKETIERDQQFRDYLDEAGQFYQFEEPENG